MQVLSLCEYFVGEDVGPNHFTPNRIVKAIKRKPFNGYSDLQVEGRRKQLRSERPEVAVEWASELLAEQLLADGPVGPTTIVPVPGHDHTTHDAVRNGGVHALAEAVASRLRNHGRHAHAWPLLHWSAAQPAAHEGGGTRDAQTIERLLEVFPSTGIGKVVLIDDVVTSGGHLVGACARLANQGYQVHDVALAVARTVYVKGEPIRTRVEECPRPMVRVDDFPF